MSVGPGRRTTEGSSIIPNIHLSYSTHVDSHCSLYSNDKAQLHMKKRRSHKLSVLNCTAQFSMREIGLHVRVVYVHDNSYSSWLSERYFETTPAPLVHLFGVNILILDPPPHTQTGFFFD